MVAVLFSLLPPAPNLTQPAGAYLRGRFHLPAPWCSATWRYDREVLHTNNRSAIRQHNKKMYLNNREELKNTMENVSATLCSIEILKQIDEQL